MHIPCGVAKVSFVSGLSFPGKIASRACKKQDTLVCTGCPLVHHSQYVFPSRSKVHFLQTNSITTLKIGTDPMSGTRDTENVRSHVKVIQPGHILLKHAPPHLTGELKRLPMPVRQSYWKGPFISFSHRITGS